MRTSDSLTASPRNVRRRAKTTIPPPAHLFTDGHSSDETRFKETATDPFVLEFESANGMQKIPTLCVDFTIV